MTRSPADPLGYYATLGLGPLADASEIKRAYRHKARLLHPDHNPFEEAHLEFIAVVEAYRVLSDPASRERYDAAALQPVPAGLIDPQDRRPEALTCSRCGRISGQPRYVRFYQVKSCLLSTRRRVVRGIFCRDCADRTAIRVSTITWLCGWWSPSGPFHTLKALWRNLRGGDMPVADNLWVLLHQARAFLVRGELELARALAEQAKAFAQSDEERMRIAEIIRTADGQRAVRRLKNRWQPWSYAPLIQGLPLAALAAGLIVAVVAAALRSQTDSVGAMINIQPAQAGETRHVAVEILKVRQGPAITEPMVALLDHFATVQVVDTTPDGEWARVLTPNGITGYVPSRYLFGGSGDEPKSQWCRDQRGPPPKNGDTLIRRSGGGHQLSVRNDAGRDVVVRLKTQNNQTLLAFFVEAGKSVTINDIPDGAFRTVFASGQGYSRACGMFLEDMEAFGAASLQATGQRIVPLVIPPVGDEPNRSHAVPLESFLDN
jgi:hypothetical protein